MFPTLTEYQQSNSNIYIRPLSSAQNKLRLILHELFDLSSPLSGRSLGRICIIALRRSTIFKEKTNHYLIKFSFLFELTDSLSQLYNHSTNIKIELDYMPN